MIGVAEFERYANDRVEDLLEAYASVRLEPSAAALSRIRSVVMAEATARAAAQRKTLKRAVDAVTPPGGARSGWLQVPWQRRVAAAGIATSLAFGTAAAVALAPPGSPFYNARLVIESAMMPPVANLDARLAAYEEQFADRIAEAEGAIARGDADSAAAALQAYQAEVAGAVAEIGEQDDRLAHLQAVLDKHIAKLEALAVKLPNETARDNVVKHAIEASERAVTKLKEKQAHGNQNPGGGNPNAGGGNPNAGGGNPNAGGGNPNAGGGNPNAGGGNPNAGGGNPNAGGGNPNGGGAKGNQGGNGNSHGNGNQGGNGNGNGNGNQDH